MHGFLTRDGIAPTELRRPGFRVETAGGATWRSRRLVLATGVVDDLPQVPGFDEFYGTGIFHCPFCDGYPVRSQRLVVYGRAGRGAGLDLELLG